MELEELEAGIGWSRHDLRISPRTLNSGTLLIPYGTPNTISHGNGGSHYCRSREVFVDRSNIFFKHAILTTYTWRMIPIGKWSLTMVIRSHPSRANVGPRDHSWPNSLHGLRCDGGRLPPNTFKRWSWRNNIFILANFYVWSVITLAPFRKSTLLGLWKSKPRDQSWGTWCGWAVEWFGLEFHPCHMGWFTCL